MSGTTKTINFLNSSNNFNNLTITGTISTTGTNIDVTSTMLSGTLTGTGTFTVTGNWDSSTGYTFTKSTSTVVMSGTSKTVKINSTPGGFYNLTTSGTITISVNALDVSNTLSVSGTLMTSGIAISGGSNLSVPNGGDLEASSSTLTFTNLTMTGGTSGIITFTSASATVSGNWDTSGAGSTFTKGTSTVTLSGATKTVKTLNSTNGFYDLTASGTITMSNATDISHTLTVSGKIGRAHV